MKDDLLMYALRVVMTTRRAFGIPTKCEDPRIIMSFFRVCERTGSVGSLQGIAGRRAVHPDIDDEYIPGATAQAAQHVSPEAARH
jgi:hypothetical protein